MELLSFSGKAYPSPASELLDIITASEQYETEYVQLDGIPSILTITLTITTQDAFRSQALHAMHSSVSKSNPSQDLKRGRCYSASTLIVFPWGKLNNEFKFRKSAFFYTYTVGNKERCNA